MSQRPSEIKKRGKFLERKATQPHGPLGGFRALHQEGVLEQTSGELGQGRAGKNSHVWSASPHLDDHFTSTLYKRKITSFTFEKTKRRCRFILQPCGLSFSQLFMVYKMTWGDIWAGRMPPSTGVISLVWSLVSLAWTATTHWTVRCTFYICPIYCHQL